MVKHKVQKPLKIFMKTASKTVIYFRSRADSAMDRTINILDE